MRWQLDSKHEEIAEIIQTEILNETLTDEEGNFCVGKVRARLSELLFGAETFLTMKDNEEMYRYQENGIYTDGSETFIRETGEHILNNIGYPNKANISFMNELVNQIKRNSYYERTIFTIHPELIAMENGVYNILTGEIREPKPEDYLTTKIPVKYDVEATCPKFEKFLKETVPEENIPLCFEFFGYCLYRAYPIQKAVMLLGSGANGKSTFISALRSFLGIENCEGIPLQNFEVNRFAVSRIYGKLANLSADLPPTELKGAGMFKALTGSDMIYAEEKFKKGFSFINTAKLVFSCNQLPATSDETDAFFRRWIIIDFPNTFEGDAVDTDILNKITTPEELSGIFNRAVAETRKVIVRGMFSGNQNTAELRERYLRMSDSTAAFHMDCLEIAPDNDIPKQTLYTTYLNYAKKKHYPTVSEKMFFKKLAEHVRIEEVRVNTNDGRVRVWRGIRFVETDKPESEPIQSGLL
jgi:putative DNA primase/helicase